MRTIALPLIVLLLTGCTAGENTVIQKATEAEQVNTDLTGLPEYAALMEEIDLELYTSEIETDNDKNRTIFFSNGTSERIYKSVYSKSDSRLKITDLSGGGLIFSKVLNP